MFKWIAKIKITFQIIGIVVILLIIFMIAIGLVVKNNVDDMSNALMENTQLQLTEIARQIAETLDASINPEALTNPADMQITGWISA